MDRVRISLSGRVLDEVEKKAERYGMSITDYIYFLLGVVEQPTVDVLIKRSLSKEGRFSFSDLIVEDLSRSKKGVIGKRFKKYIEEHPEIGIKVVGSKKGEIYERIVQNRQ